MNRNDAIFIICYVLILIAIFALLAGFGLGLP